MNNILLAKSNNEVKYYRYDYYIISCFSRIQNMARVAEVNTVTDTCESLPMVIHTDLIHQNVTLQEIVRETKIVATNLHTCRKSEKRREIETSNVKNIQVT